jgi:hypothetical protein
MEVALETQAVRHSLQAAVVAGVQLAVQLSTQVVLAALVVQLFQAHHSPLLTAAQYTEAHNGTYST